MDIKRLDSLDSEFQLQLDKLLASHTIFFGFLELLPVVLFAVHLEDDVDVLS